MLSGRTFQFLSLATLLILLTGISGCSTHGRVILEGETGRVIVDVEEPVHGDHQPDSPSTAHYPRKGRYESRLPKIPPGHMPPRGKCRIWFPGRPPGQQPPPGDCHELERNVPPGAWLIRG